MSTDFDLVSLRKTLEVEESKVFYKDVEMICDDSLAEWKDVLECNVKNYGFPYINLFNFSVKDSVYIIKQKDNPDEKTYDICEEFTNTKNLRICREYKAYTFFTSKNFSKYIKNTFEGCDYKLVYIYPFTFIVQLDITNSAVVNK